MIRRETAEPVVQYLRALTYNGELSTDEVWKLAEWLNQQPDKIVNSWPAKPLVSALQTAFADKNLSHTELEDLAHTIVAIEELWTETFPPSRDGPKVDAEMAPSAVIDELKPQAPAIPIKAEIPADGRSGTFTVDLQHHSCNCPEWEENRAAFPEGDYRRCCVHLTRAYHGLVAQGQAGLRRDPLFVGFIEEQARRNKGAEVDIVWRLAVVNRTRVLYGASPASEWVSVFAPDEEEEGHVKRFGFNRRKKRWSYGDRPRQIAWQIESIFSQSQPQVLMSRASAS